MMKKTYHVGFHEQALRGCPSCLFRPFDAALERNHILNVSSRMRPVRSGQGPHGHGTDTSSFLVCEAVPETVFPWVVSVTTCHLGCKL